LGVDGLDTLGCRCVTSQPRPGEVPAVTVLIAAYNAASFLHRAVASALRQSLPVKEVLIVDDASTDGTVEEAHRLSRSDERIRVIALPRNGGPSAARNAGLDAAAGEWIAVLDADDAFLPSRLEQMLACALRMRADVVVDNFHYYHLASNTYGSPVLQQDAPDSVASFAEYLSKARPYGQEVDWGLLKPMFRKAFLDERRLRYPLKTRHGEDFLLMCDVFLQGATYAVCRQPGYLYTSADANLSRTHRDYWLMYEHTLQLLQDRRVANDPLLTQRIHERAAAVRRLAAEYDLARLRTAHDYSAIAKRALSDKTFTWVLTKRVVRRLLNISGSGASKQAHSRYTSRRPH
jgi:succinoglycan biosynthesis protein ExoO